MKKDLSNNLLRLARALWTQLCMLSVLLSTSLYGQIKLTGKEPGALRFDVRIELNRYGDPRKHRDGYALVFARYWVASDYYCIKVIWAEPHTSDSALQMPPGPMSIVSNQAYFSLHHDGCDMYNHSYKKPLGLQSGFQDMFGSYSIDYMRFSEQQAISERLYKRDLSSIQDINSVSARGLDLLMPVGNNSHTREVAQVQVKTKQGRIESLQLLDMNRQLLKTVSYAYTPGQEKGQLCQQSVELPERPITVGYQGVGMKVTLAGKVYQIKEFSVPYHRGGRHCTIDYESIRFGDSELVLPVCVSVCRVKDNKVLRSVCFSNYKKVDLNEARASRAAKKCSVLPKEEQRFRELYSKYNRLDESHVEKTDVATIKVLRVCFQKALDSPKASVGEKLKCLNILMELDRMLAEDKDLERQYADYLSVLCENKFDKMVLVGGFGMIERTVAKGRSKAAKALLTIWINNVLAVKDADSILAFARKQIVKKRLWTTAILLQKLAHCGKLSTDVCFEIYRLRCTALDGLYRLMNAKTPTEKGMTAKLQVDWVLSSTDKEGLKKSLLKSILTAQRCFANLSQPIESQRAAKEWLDEIQMIQMVDVQTQPSTADADAQD